MISKHGSEIGSGKETNDRCDVGEKNTERI